MKIALTTSGKSLDAPVDSRFGRAPGFLLYDLETKTFSVVDNELNLNAPQGAGIQAAETIVRSGARALVTGHCGPKAFRSFPWPASRLHDDGLTRLKRTVTQGERLSKRRRPMSKGMREGGG